ncbi:MAG: nitrogenase component 1 [Myxococcota bacterium]
MHRYYKENQDIEGQRLACGKYSRRVLQDLLKLSDIHCNIIAMGWVGNRIVIDILPQGKKEDSLITLYIAKRVDTQPSLLKTDFLDIYYSSNKNNEDFARHILSLKINDITFAQLTKILKDDPELGDPSLSMPTSEAADRPENHLDSWGGRDLYANFFAEGEFARGQLDSVNIYENCVFIQHSDIECVSLRPNLDLRLIKFLVRYPWLSPNPEKYSGIRRDELPDVNKFFSTDLREKDIIMGHNKVRDALEYVLNNVKKKNIFLSNTCTPVVIGEDVESLVKKAKQRRKDLLYLTVTPQSMEVVLKDLFKIPSKRMKRKAHNLINLMGYEDDNYIRQLIKFLKDLGIEVNSTVIPDVSVKTLNKYFKGGVDILKPNSLWSHLYMQLNSMSGHKYISIDSPYGFFGTIRWIIELLRIPGRKISEDEIMKRIKPEIIDRYLRLREAMKSIGVIFIVRKDEVGYLTDSAKSWGVPLIKFFREMGSKIEVFIKAQSLEEAKSASTQLLGFISDYHNFEIRYFDSFENMMRLIKSSMAQLVFTNHSNDWRITSGGKHSLSLTDFEVGFEGAIYTMENILNLANNQFFKRYARYLQRDFKGSYEEREQR